MRKLFIALICCLPLLAQAKEAEFANGDPEMHKRVMEVSAELRCLVCQGQSLADSNADFAVDMRNQIQEMMEAGRSNREVVDFLVERYGDYIRYRPPFNATTAVLWFGPFVLLLIGVGVLYYNVLQRRKEIKEVPLSAEEQHRAEALLQQESGDK